MADAPTIPDYRGVPSDELVVLIASHGESIAELGRAGHRWGWGTGTRDKLDYALAQIGIIRKELDSRECMGA